MHKTNTLNNFIILYSNSYLAMKKLLQPFKASDIALLFNNKMTSSVG